MYSKCVFTGPARLCLRMIKVTIKKKTCRWTLDWRSSVLGRPTNAGVKLEGDSLESWRKMRCLLLAGGPIMTLSEQSLLLCLLVYLATPVNPKTRSPPFLKLLKKTVAIQSQGERKRQTEMRCESNREINKIMLLLQSAHSDSGVSVIKGMLCVLPRVWL
jgi:hypothetical protein